MDESTDVLLLSIRPEHSAGIFAGAKKVELRRKRPRISPGAYVIVYETAPTMALVGAFEAGHILTGRPKSLWAQVRAVAGINRKRFDEYFDGAPEAYAIEVARAWLFREPVPLQGLRRSLPGFHPPQGFAYLCRCDMERAGIPLGRHRAVSA